MIPAIVRAASALSKPAGLVGKGAGAGIAEASAQAIPNLSKFAKGIQEVGQSAGSGLEFLQTAKQEFGTATGLVQGLAKDIAEAPILPFKMALSTMQGIVSQYVSAFSPQAANQFGMILKDIAAVVGKTLLPVARAFGQVLRFLGDMLATVAPQFQTFLVNVIEQAKPVWEKFGQIVMQVLPSLITVGKVMGETLLTVLKAGTPIVLAFADVLSALAEPLQLMVELFSPLIPVVVDLVIAMNPVFILMKAITPLMTLFAQELRNTMTVLLNFLGITLPKLDRKSSGGQAFVQAGTTNAQSALSRLQQNAFGVGTSGGERPEVQTANNTKLLLDYFTNKFPKDLADAIVKFGKDKGQEFVQGAVDKGANFLPFGRLALDVARGRNPFGG